MMCLVTNVAAMLVQARHHTCHSHLPWSSELLGLPFKLKRTSARQASTAASRGLMARAAASADLSTRSQKRGTVVVSAPSGSSRDLHSRSSSTAARPVGINYINVLSAWLT